MIFFLMEPHEISTVLGRAADIRAKINHAIFRCSNENSDMDRYDEVKSLTSIRDSLDSLQEQLQCLESLQHQQRLEKDAILADLEESRGILCKRLKEHNGKEWEVIQEALAFSVGSAEDKDDLLLPPYYMRIGNSASFSKSERHNPSDGIFTHNNGVKFTPVDKQDTGIFSTMEEGKERDYSSGSLEDVHRKDKGNLHSTASNFGRFFNFTFRQAVALVGKLVLVLVGAAAATAVSGASRRRQTENNALELQKSFVLTHTPYEAICPEEGSREETCPPGKLSAVLDGVKRSAVKERVELPFQHDVNNFDASLGRG